MAPSDTLTADEGRAITKFRTKTLANIVSTKHFMQSYCQTLYMQFTYLRLEELQVNVLMLLDKHGTLLANYRKHRHPHI